MKHRIADVAQDADKFLPPFKDGSQIGVNYADAWIKPMNTKLEDGTKVSCKRKGLKLTIALGDKKGEGLMRRLEKGPEIVEILNAALVEAAIAAGLTYSVEDGGIFLEAHDA